MTACEIPWRDPLTAFAPLSGQEGAVLLDSAAEAGGRGRWTILAAYPQKLVIDPANPFDTLEQTIQAMREPALPRHPEAPPFHGGLIGWISYEAGRHLETLPVPKTDDISVPEVAFGVYKAALVFDTSCRRAFLTHTPDGKDTAKRLLDAAGTTPLPPPRTDGILLYPEQDDEEAAQAIAQVIDFIRAGDIFQANWTRRFMGHLPDGFPVFDLYRRLRQASPAPFAAFAHFGGATVLSASPERFLKVQADGTVETRPIKGTRKRGQTPAEDKALLDELINSKKDQAENLMIVDLMRNDLSRVCRTGSVKVPVLNGPETFASVHHLVSVVRGRLRKGENAISLLKATFPGGSITGAPKIRAMEIINTLEPGRRGPYCGSIFWIGADGSMDSSIVIRTLVAGRTGRLVAQAGGGIVADSSPADEVEEARTKVAPLLQAAAGTAP
ncbi:aminodeoxychorismate synthase component I [Haematospirillum sp. 15-248]|uniref:aminodeoxychorismate synthase component I n=1 Tax=Haematospirillum sp. 15-248 TaxID=2723107 RepID=UPI00143A01DC|nr:aminodeoxychorismate synthase component I [Haematospirillum sp. 15-248]NKD87792.1 aminodeoxychorismate synthase component I [Haematospirillum sp. 15-248]